MEFIPESVLDALNDFEKKSSEIPQILENYLLKIAENGDILFPWGKLKPLLKRKLEVVLDEFYETCPVEISASVPNFEAFNFDDLKKSILQAVDDFTSAPFTIQRICELVTNPRKHYNRTDKYMRGIEKNVLVIRTIEARSAQGEGNVQAMVNGMVSNSPTQDDGDCYNGHKASDSLAPADANTSANRVLLENFANVFPSAACIPSASTICVSREIDSTFMENTECVGTLEVSSETTISTESDGSEPKSDQFSEVTDMEQQDMPGNTGESSLKESDPANYMTYLVDQMRSELVRHSSNDSQSSEASSSFSSDETSSSESSMKNDDSFDPDTCDMVTEEHSSSEKISECELEIIEEETIEDTECEEETIEDKEDEHHTAAGDDECVLEIIEEDDCEEKTTDDNDCSLETIEEKEKLEAVSDNKAELESNQNSESKQVNIACEQNKDCKPNDIDKDQVTDIIKNSQFDQNKSKDAKVKLVDDGDKSTECPEIKDVSKETEFEPDGDFKNETKCPQDNTVSQSDCDPSPKTDEQHVEEADSSTKNAEDSTVSPSD